MRAPGTIALALAALAACGKDHPLVDAGVLDANRTDASTGPDADPHGVVTVTVLSSDGSGTPASGVKVAFVEPDGELAAEATTGADGKASASVLPGASVTAVYALAPTDHQIETILGVKPGDDLTIGSAKDSTAAGTFTVNLIDTGGTTSYAVYGPCGAGTFTVPQAFTSNATATVPVALTFQRYCAQTTMDLVAVRYDVDFVAADYVELKDVAFTDGGTVDQTAAWTPMPLLAATYSDIPADVIAVSFDDRVPDLLGFGYGALLTPDAGAAAVNAPVPPAAHALVTSTIESNAHGGSQQIFDGIDGTKTSYALDVGASLLPWVDAPVLDPATATITTATSGTGTGDAFRVEVSFDRPDPNGGGSGSGTPTDFYDWTVWSASPGTITLPTLPADLADNDPKAGDSLGSSAASVFDLAAATGYDAVRAHLDGGLDAYLATRGAIGTLRVSTSTNQLGFQRFLRALRVRSR